MPERRPVEARAIIGNGNATDPESIQELEDEWARRVRGQLKPPAKKFSRVAEESAEKRERERESEEEAGVEEAPAVSALPRKPSLKKNVRPLRV